MLAADDYRAGLGDYVVTGFSKAAVRQDIYNDVFLEEPDHPYSTVMMSSKERYAGSHLYYKRISDFMLYDVAAKTGLSFKELLELPTYLVEYTLDQLRQQSSENISQGKKAGAGMDEVTKSLTEGFSHLKKKY